MIPCASIAHGKLTGIQLRATRLTHCLSEICAIERQPLRSQSIDVGRLGILSAIQRQIVVGAVIRHDDQEIGFPRCGKGIRVQEQHQGDACKGKGTLHDTIKIWARIIRDDRWELKTCAGWISDQTGQTFTIGPPSRSSLS